MAITAKAPRGGVVEIVGSASHVFLLRCAEIERFEDQHRGIFDLWDGFFGRGQKPTSKEVKDLLALALVGGGKTDAQADKIIENGGAEMLLRYYQIAQAVLGIALMPDALDQTPAVKKKAGSKGDGRFNVRSLIRSGIVAGLKPVEIRTMIPRDVRLVFDGWQQAHSPKKPGDDAPSLAEARALAERYG
jgi:hypothetical protein